MFKLHTRDGKTVTANLADAEQAREWIARLDKSEGQATLTGVTVISQHGFQLNVPVPEGFGPARVALEHAPPAGHRGFERVCLFAGDSRLVVTVHAGAPAARIDWRRR